MGAHETVSPPARRRFGRLVFGARLCEPRGVAEARDEPCRAAAVGPRSRCSGQSRPLTKVLLGSHGRGLRLVSRLHGPSDWSLPPQDAALGGLCCQDLRDGLRVFGDMVYMFDGVVAVVDDEGVWVDGDGFAFEGFPDFLALTVVGDAGCGIDDSC